MSQEEPTFRVNWKSFIGHTLVEEGAEVGYTPPAGGHIGENLSPLNDAAQALVDAQTPPHPDKATPAKADPLDHDGDGRKGGSKPRAKKPEPETAGDDDGIA